MSKNIFSTILLSSILLSCSYQERQLSNETQKIAREMHQEFVAARLNIEDLVDNLQNIYNHLDQYDLSITNLDVKEGGLFTTYRNNDFYYKVTNIGAAFYLSPQKPITEDMKKEVKKATYTEKYMMDAYENHKDIIYMVFLGFDKPYNLALLYPWYDMISVFPPGVQLTQFEWYTRGLKSSGKAMWSEYPFTDLYNGWVIDISMPIKTSQGNIGVAVINMGIRKIVTKYLGNSQNNVLLIGPGMSLLGISSGVKDILDLKVIEDIDYTSQMKGNTFIQDEYKLSHQTQPEILQDLAKSILKGDAVFEGTYNGQQLYFTISKVPETGFFIVGVLRK